MNIFMKKKLLAILPIAVATSWITGCGATLDLKAEDDQTIHYDIEMKKSIAPKLNIVGGYKKTSGDSDQFLSDGNIILSGQRANIEDRTRLEHDFSMELISAGLEFTLINNEKFKLHLSPRLSHLHYDLDTNILGRSLSTQKNRLGLGGAIEFKYVITPKLRIGVEGSSYALRSDENYSSDAAVTMDFIINDALSIGIGYRTWYLNEFFGKSSLDRNYCLESSNTENTSTCEESDIELESRGLLLDLKFSF